MISLAKAERFRLQNEAAYSMRTQRKAFFWIGFYAGWSSLGWIIILAHYFGIGG